MTKDEIDSNRFWAEFDRRHKAGKHTVYSPSTGSIRQIPQNYGLAFLNYNREWVAAPDKGSSLNAHSLTLAIKESKTTDPEKLADYIDAAFFG